MCYARSMPVALLACIACAHPMGRAHPTTVEDLYALGIEDLESGLYPEALKDFAEVKTKYPYTRYAALAELRTADTHFRRAKYLEAIDAYRNFIKFHPNHDQAAYALFEIGESYFEQIPADWWFLPPGAEKDQTNTRLAIAAYQDMLARFNTGYMAEKSREHLNACRRKLADHEMYVARFYLRRERYEAAAQRAEAVLKDYGGLDLDAEALWIVGSSRLSIGDKARARAAFQELVTKYPGDKQAGAARGKLQSLENTMPAPKQGS